MILKNKTKQTQSLYLKDGSKTVVRPLRTVVLEKNNVGNFDSAVWQVESEEVKKTIKSD